jgi:hypothetical protein
MAISDQAKLNLLDSLVNAMITLGPKRVVR